MTSIGSYAFYGCTGLTLIRFNAVSANDLTSSGSAFYNAGSRSNGISVVFGDSVQKIPAYLFYVSASSYRPNIKNVTIGDNVASIGSSAFMGCSALTSVKFNNPNGWTAGGASIPGSSLSTPSAAAKCLVSTYVNYTWLRN